MEISFLIDTNIAIQFEEADSTGEIRSNFASLHAQILKYKTPIFVHPVSVEDVRNDKDEIRKKETLSRLNKYPFLQSPPKPVGNELEELFGGFVNTNDVVDANILYAVYRSCVSYLVTEDLGIHKRARNAGLEDRVLSVAETIDLLKRQYEPAAVYLPSVEEEYAYNISIADPIFDSLKADYPGFEDWYQQRCCAKHRKAWVIRNEGRVAGICIYKHDNNQEYSGIDMPSMKMATFKVSDDFRGAKYGELLLKMALNYAISNGMKTVWVTAQPKQTVLIQFLKDFGFNAHSEYAGKDMIFFKQLFVPTGTQDTPPFDFHVKFSPHFIDDARVKKYAIPIQPTYHDLLFPEISLQLSLGTGIPGNTIKKVYLSHSRIRELEQGSLIYFYRSSPEQCLTTLGIVERCKRMSDLSAIASAIGKRSVYSLSEVSQMVKDSGEILIIRFRLIAHLPQNIPLDELTKKRVFNRRPPQSIMNLPESAYTNLKSIVEKRDNIKFDFEMKLSPGPFAVTKNGKKTIEIRLSDEKRRKMRRGNIIKFVNTQDRDTIITSVKEIRKYPTLKELVESEDLSRTGGLYRDSSDWLEKLKEYYPNTDKECVAIEFKLLKK